MYKYMHAEFIGVTISKAIFRAKELKIRSRMNSYLAVMNEIHVLLVDHDTNALLHTSKLLELCRYKVTVVQFASAAMTMLSNGKVKIDFVMANINSPDLHGFKLLQQATTMNIPIILMSVDDDTSMAMRAIEHGAFLYIKKPATAEMLSCLWQHLAKAKICAMRERERLMAARDIGIREGIHRPGNNLLVVSDKSFYKGREDEEYYDSDTVSRGNAKRKVCTEWTRELHEKFIHAVELLGEGRCFPKEILDLMNEPGLTRMQVASHLQKCRNENWRFPEERKANGQRDAGESQHKLRRFGSMPRLVKPVGGGDRSKTRPETESGADKNGSGGPIMADAGASVPQTSIIISSNPRQPSPDDYFGFQDLLQNFSGVHQGYQFELAYGYDQVASMENRSQWNGSEGSNYGNDDSEQNKNKDLN